MDEMKFKIVSGGQTGIDQAALAAAVAAEVPYGGWVPKGRRTEVGTLDAKYTAMQEMPTDDYRKRTRQNVVDSDATLILTRGEPEGGTLQTIEFCKQHQKPYRVYDLAQNVADLLPPHWVVELLIELVNEIGKDGLGINVAGPRESKCPGIQAEATKILTNAFKIAKHTERQPDGKYQSFLLYLERMMPAGIESMQYKTRRPSKRGSECGPSSGRCSTRTLPSMTRTSTRSSGFRRRGDGKRTTAREKKRRGGEHLAPLQ